MNAHLPLRGRPIRARALAILISGMFAGSVLAVAPIAITAASADVAPAAISPGTVCAGSSTPFTLTVSVPSGLAQVTSVGVAAPGFTLGSIVGSTLGSASIVLRGSLTGNNGVNASVPATPDDQLVLYNVSLSGAQTASLTFTATPTAASSGDWVVYFEGDTSDGPFWDPDEGDDDAYVPVHTTIAAGCHLVFTAQPADAGKNKTVTSVALDDGAAPVALQVRDAGNAPVAIDTSVNVALKLNGVAAPGLTAPVSPVAVSGGATTLAPQVSIPSSSKAYTLQVTPTNGAIAGITSSAFQIWDAATACAVNCTLTTGGTANTFTVAATPQAGAGIGATLNAVNLDCSPLKFGGFSPIPGTQTFGWTYTGGGFKTETILIGKSLLTSKLLLAKALLYQVCYSAPTQFTTYFGLKAQPDPTVSAAMGQPFFTGILRPCFSSNPTSAVAQSRAPCVLDRQWTSAGEVVKVLSNPGDPYSR